MFNLSIETCVTVLESAIVNRRTAFQMELAVGLGVFLSQGGIALPAKKLLNQVYAEAGYDCLSITGMDYKTINRRINATAALYEHVNVNKWVGKLEEQDALRAIFVALQPYEFHAIQDVLRITKRLPPPVASRVEVNPHTSILAPSGTQSGQDGIMRMFRRASDTPDARVIETEHIKLPITKDVTQTELLELAAKIIAMAKSGDVKNGDNLLLTT